MVKIISQETFNEAVKENMTLFELESAEAIRETVAQFRSQGIDLTNIIKEEWCVLGGDDPLSSALSKISINSSKLESIQKVIDLCKKDISIRLKAAEMGAYTSLISVLKDSDNTEEISLSLDALSVLMDGYPDLLDDQGVNLIFSLLKENEQEVIVAKVLDWAKKCCVKHERNRKTFMDNAIPDILKDIMTRFTSKAIILGSCGLITALSQDDDVREAVSSAHANACTLSSTLLSSLTSALGTTDSETLASVLRAQTTLLVRDTICQQYVDLGGLDNLLSVLNTGPSQNVLKHGFNVLACLAGHDDIKDSIVKTGLGPLIATSLWRGQDSAALCTSGLLLVARLCLRSAANSRSLYNVGLGDCIAHIMKTHSNEEKLQSAGCLAIRNMVSHCPELRSGLLALDLEDLLEQLPKRFPSLTDYSKGTLLALDCKVHLKEEWTGIHGDKLKECTP